MLLLFYLLLLLLLLLLLCIVCSSLCQSQPVSSLGRGQGSGVAPLRDTRPGPEGWKVRSGERGELGVVETQRSHCGWDRTKWEVAVGTSWLCWETDPLVPRWGSNILTLQVWRFFNTNIKHKHSFQLLKCSSQQFFYLRVRSDFFLIDFVKI